MISNLIGVGALGKGGRHVEPQGDQKIINHTTGDVCYIKYRASGWMKNKKDQTVEAVIKDADGNEKFVITGKYTTSLQANNMSTGETFNVYTAPTYPTEIDPYYIYNFNLKAL